jgi:hypothetical protein
MNKNYGNALFYQKLHQRRIPNNLAEAGKCRRYFRRVSKIDL